MNETAAHLVENMYPVQPLMEWILQWVLSVLKRLRYFMQRDATAITALYDCFFGQLQSSPSVQTLSPKYALPSQVLTESVREARLHYQ
jgi:hypothetical protein